MDHIWYSRLPCVYFKKRGENIDDSSVKKYVNKIENRITFKTKTGYYLVHLIPETMKLFQSTENTITKNQNGVNVPHFEITEVVLIHCNIVSNDYQQDSRVLSIFVPSKPCGSLLEISRTNHIFPKAFNSEFQNIEVWFTDQNSQLLEIEDKINLFLIIK